LRKALKKFAKGTVCALNAAKTKCVCIPTIVVTVIFVPISAGAEPPMVNGKVVPEWNPNNANVPLQHAVDK
jgi:hypothetical protein